jgi:hypothetical protein
LLQLNIGTCNWWKNIIIKEIFIFLRNRLF